ncbi:kinase-like protein [Auricularia subglabra TFB-10046 SS5]|uniref:Kinase-like protein n=1 Tax=Auricularia subglabra (strain TFB-10046 / SS5) TaxID=717982 RepID=J0WYV6_AURST|nr:kinase-like protein [Auricularia subglabra TFB-10046 SS5]
MAAFIAQSAAEGYYELSARETFWRDHQPYLLSRGYALRPRYTPGWSAPWIGTDISPLHFEESVISRYGHVMDARRLSDGTIVSIKWSPAKEHTANELTVLQLVSTPDMLADPRNHANPLLDWFNNPGEPGFFLVTPWLYGLDLVPLENVNEVVDMMLQLFEGLAFLHEHRVAHRDCTNRNILQDVRPAFRKVPHPQGNYMTYDNETLPSPVARCRCKPSIRYYFIDFGISSKFEGDGGHLVTGILGRDPTAPELSPDVPYDPFKLDVYILGNFFMQEYLEKYSNLAFLRPLLRRMTRPTPESRPTMEEALRRLRRVAEQPSGLWFRWRLRARTEGYLESLVRDVFAITREGYYQARHLVLGGDELSFGRPRAQSGRQ